jgi:hypothetical protein
MPDKGFRCRASVFGLRSSVFGLPSSVFHLPSPLLLHLAHTLNHLLDVLFRPEKILENRGDFVVAVKQISDSFGHFDDGNEGIVSLANSACGVGQKLVRKLIGFLELFMAGYAVLTDAEYGNVEGFIVFPKGTNFSCAASCKIFWVKEEYTGLTIKVF